MTDHPADAILALPAAERLPADRVPTIAELTAAAERYAFMHSVCGAGALYYAVFRWLVGSDPGREGRTVAQIARGLTARGARVEGQDLRDLVRTLLDEAAVVPGPAEARSVPFEALPGRRWRVRAGITGDRFRLNPGYLLRGAATEGWDLLIPGTGYDWKPAPPEQVVVLAGPSGRLDEPVRVSVTDGSIVTGEDPDTAFLVLPDPSYPAVDPIEITFDWDGSSDYSGWTMDEVLPESPGGTPDPPVVGWVAWGMGKVAVAYTASELEPTAWEASLEGLEGGTESAHFWVSVARAICGR